VCGVEELTGARRGGVEEGWCLALEAPKRERGGHGAGQRWRGGPGVRLRRSSLAQWAADVQCVRTAELLAGTSDEVGTGGAGPDLGPSGLDLGPSGPDLGSRCWVPHSAVSQERPDGVWGGLVRAVGGLEAAICRGWRHEMRASFWSCSVLVAGPRGCSSGGEVLRWRWCVRQVWLPQRQFVTCCDPSVLVAFQGGLSEAPCTTSLES
jgi:hypothetical protein